MSASSAVELVRPSVEAVPDVCGSLVRAFADDPLTSFFFGRGPHLHATLTQFFSIMMQARLATEMPVIAARQGSKWLGAAMGYEPVHPDWPAEYEEEWIAMAQPFEPGLTERFGQYETISGLNKPTEPHHYLGVLGVDPAAQGLGVGKSLLLAFCDLADGDPASTGVYLETGSPASLEFYRRNGFHTLGSGVMGDATMWCVFRPSR